VTSQPRREASAINAHIFVERIEVIAPKRRHADNSGGPGTDGMPLVQRRPRVDHNHWQARPAKPMGHDAGKGAGLDMSRSGVEVDATDRGPGRSGGSDHLEHHVFGDAAQRVTLKQAYREHRHVDK
jgi:hypothetical protein